MVRSLSLILLFVLLLLQRKTRVSEPVNLNEELEESDAGDWIDTVLQKFVVPVPESVITEPDPIPKVI